MSDTSLVFNAVGRDRGVNALLARTAGGVRAANMASAASTVALGGAMASAAAHAVALGSSAMGAVGAVGLLPAVIAATAATVVAAKASTFGLADAWKATGQAATGGGGAAVNVAKRVAAAQREVRAATQAYADTQRAALEAQQAITRARQSEVERLDDLARTVTGARLDEEAAVNAVAKAERELANARRTGTPDDVRDAELAYRQAQQAVEDVKDRVADLSAEQEDGARKGVEGSDSVIEALRRHEDAQRAAEQAAQRLADAQDAVKEASAGAASGGIDPAAAALAKLSPNGRAVILTLRALTSSWQGAARAGQQSTFANVSGDLRRMSGVYLPLATSWLTRMGGGFNVAIRESMGLSTTRGFVRDVGTTLDNTALSTNRLARAVRPVINGIMQFVAIGSGFLPGMAGSTLTIAQRFERWAVAARNSGQMQQWIGNALGILRQLGAVAGNVVGSVVAVFKAGDDGGSTLDGLVRGSAAMRAWLESAQGQERVGEVLRTLRGILAGVGAILPVVAGHGDEFNDALNVTGTVVGFAAGHLDTLAKLLPVIAAGFVIFKAAEAGANIARIASLPIMAMQVAANWGLRSAMIGHTAALAANTAASRGAAASTAVNTAATTAGDVAQKRSVISMVASRVAMIASGAAAKAAAAGQWLLNAALYANPIGLIILAVIALVAGFVLLWRNSETFRNGVTGAFNAVLGAIQFVWSWVSQNWPLLLAILTGPIGLAVLVITRNWDSIKAGASAAYNWVIDGGARLLGWFVGLGGRLRRGLVNVASILTSPFRAGFNLIASLWNRTVGRLHFTVPTWVPGFGGNGFSMPQLPMLAKGGTATRAGMAVVGEEGPEVVHLGAGASVVPLPKGGGGGASSGGTIKVIVLGGDREAVAEFRRLKATYGF